MAVTRLNEKKTQACEKCQQWTQLITSMSNKFNYFVIKQYTPYSKKNTADLTLPQQLQKCFSQSIFTGVLVLNSTFKIGCIVPEEW